MSEVPSTGTPRLSDISSLDSPQESLDQATPTGFNLSSKLPTKPTLTHSNTFHVPSNSYFPDEIRRSPDSDVVASSDEEADNTNYLSNLDSKQKTVENISSLSSRRPSYAAEFSNRPKNLTSLNAPHSPVTSGETGPWSLSTSAQDRKNSLNLTWTGGSIWNPDSQIKLQNKVMQNGGTNGNLNRLFMGNDNLSSAVHNNQSSDLGVPVPPNPQPRNYRSMSFSVGQRELEDNLKPRLSPPVQNNGARVPGLQHRPSRPSMLSGEQFASNGPLHSVYESLDSTEYDNDPSISDFNMAKVQAAASRSQFGSLRLKNRSSSATVLPTRNHSIGAGLTSSLFSGRRDDDTIEEFQDDLGNEADFDVAQASALLGNRRLMEPSRRFSEAPQSSHSFYPENQRLELLKKQHWYSAGGPFAEEDENDPQSRRHSFAAVSNNANNEYNIDPLGGYDGKRTSSPPTYDDSNLANEFSRVNLDGYALEERRKSLSMGSPYTAQMLKYPHMPGAAHHSGQLGMDTQRGSIPSMPGQQGRGQQLLYLVSFKACRADIFYVQDGTGLRVKNGDLVIVEADRGTDLGTVTGENVTWQQAKDLKESAAQQHFEWLMMFSTRRPGGALANNGIGPTPLLVNGQTASAAGIGLGNQHMQPGQEAATAEFKPKMIKRLAQVHEIQTLRDKEANEAKAKRVCQQKVLEHRLPMEILDAEFQMDWKKLTFYYYADSYINFNSLVTDLFKIYKTRIWMSAMNPASFAHTGPLPMGLGSGPSPTGPHGQINDHMLDSQAALLAMQQQFAQLGAQQYGGYPATIPRTLLAGLPPNLVPQHLGHPLQLPLYNLRPSLVPHQDFTHLPQQQQNSQNTLFSNGSSGGNNSNIGMSNEKIQQYGL